MLVDCYMYVRASRCPNAIISLAVIGNILILRGDIEIQPPERNSVSYEFLSQLVGEYLLLNCPDVDISAALSIMPRTTSGYTQLSSCQALT
jgi:ubiquitin carboxyl-terminal hydrolase MINDY-1/2